MPGGKNVVVDAAYVKDKLEAIAGPAEPLLLGDGDEGLELPQLHALSIADRDAMKQISALQAIVVLAPELAIVGGVAHDLHSVPVG